MVREFDARTLSRNSKDDVLERDDHKCQYCGCDADCVDHIIPWSHCHDNSPFNLVAACSLCNSVASNKVFDTFAEKKNYIVTKRLQMLARRSVPIWLESEVAEMGGRLRDMVISTCIVVKDYKEGVEIGKRLAHDGFLITFGDGDSVGLEELTREAERIGRRVRERANTTSRVQAPNKNPGPEEELICGYCEAKFLSKLAMSGARRLYCSPRCKSRAAIQRKAARAAHEASKIKDPHEIGPDEARP